MRSKLSLFCDGLIEAAWLAAAIVVPLLFNVRAAKIFEGDKIALLRSLALLGVLAWGVRLLETRGDGAADSSEIGLRSRLIAFFRRPLVLPVVALVLAHSLATAASVWPHGSLWGSYERRQGLYATLCYVLLFALAAGGLRRPSQVDRLIGLVVVTSIPVSLYAVAQRLGLDPVPWGQDVAERVISTLGNPIFTAGYLIMVLPLALGRTVAAASAIRVDEERRPGHITSVAFHGAVVILQLAAIVLTQSRGPMIGLLGSLFFFGLLWAISQRRTRWVALVVALAVLAGALLVVLNLPQTPLAGIEKVPYLGRLTAIRGERTLRSRALMWEGAVDMATATPLRALVGYGPESARVAFYPHITPQLADLMGTGMTTGRFHNATMDALVGTGFFGLAAYLALFGSVFAWSLRSLGMIRSRAEMRRFAALLAGGALVGVPGSWALAGGPRLIALTVPAGLLLALVGYVVVSGLLRPPQETASRRHQLLRVALFSAVLAHFVEIQTGIAVTATRSQFWLYAAMVAAVAAGLEQQPSPARAWRGRPAAERKGRSRRARQRAAPVLNQPRLVEVAVYGLGAALLLIVLSFDFLTPAFDFRLQEVVALVTILLVVWLAGGALTLLQVGVGASSTRGNTGWGSVVVVYGVTSFGFFAVFPFCHIAATNSGEASTGVVVVLYVFVFAVLFALAFALFRASVLANGSPPPRFWRNDRWWLYPVLTLVVALLIWRTNVNVVRAEVFFAVAQSYREADQFDRSIALYQRAIDLAPRQDEYYPFLGQAYLGKALIEQQDVWFERARESFERATALNPLKPDRHAYLGLFYYYWGTQTTDSARAQERLQAALSSYERATSISPYTEGPLLEQNRLGAHLKLAEVYLAQDLVDAAVVELLAAAELAPPEQKGELEQRAAELEAR